MNGSRQAPPGGPADGMRGTACIAVPEAVQSGSSAPHPPLGQERSRWGLDSQPPTSYLELGPLNGAVPSARIHARLVIQEWGFDREFAETAELLVSELMTNALAATRALQRFLPSPIRLWLMLDRNQVTVVVWDANPQPPVARKSVPADAEGGRGLLLVDTMAERWGWTPTPGIGGKSVWCEVVPKLAS